MPLRILVLMCEDCGECWDGELKHGRDGELITECPSCHKQNLHEGTRTDHSVRTLEDIPAANREWSSPYTNQWGDKVTANGIDWSERMQDGDYIYAVTHASEPDDPADWDDNAR